MTFHSERNIAAAKALMASFLVGSTGCYGDFSSGFDESTASVLSKVESDVPYYNDLELRIEKDDKTCSSGPINLGVSDSEIEKLCEDASLSYFDVRSFLVNSVLAINDSGLVFLHLDISSYADPEGGNLIVSSSFVVSGSTSLLDEAELRVAEVYFENPANFFFEITFV